MPQQDENNKERPGLLTVLCILTFIGSGFSLVANFAVFLTFHTWVKAMEEGVFDMLDGTLEMEAVEMLLNVNPAYFLFQAVFFTMSFVGALLMWNLKKAGFHIYTTAQLLLLIIGKVFMPELPFPVIPLLLAATFVLLYARNLRYMS